MIFIRLYISAIVVIWFSFGTILWLNPMMSSQNKLKHTIGYMLQKEKKIPKSELHYLKCILLHPLPMFSRDNV